ncbi:GNAT family N-acetyltransferase [Saccharopolyspora griseoalba]|uniref:GNAT family N-acetyltransferase n=1 Tax=Saccharopolyspora griseoalba TaxID=1431848 RepID=A0ABW2LSC9_9PSEU
MLIRRETAADIPAVRAVHTAAFADPERPLPAEVGLVDELRSGDAWIPELALVAQLDGDVVGHVVGSRASVGEVPVLALGPIGVLPRVQRRGVGSALMHAVLGAADALGEPLVGLLGHLDYYPRFGFVPAAEHGITPPVPDWATHFQVRPLAAHDPAIRGEFGYADPFMRL